MRIKTNILILLISFLLLGCVPAGMSNKIINPPTKSFVKIIHQINIISCTDKSDKKCPLGRRVSSGSGMGIELVPGFMTVITAGHVCDVGVTNAIEKYSQFVEVIDHNATVHQAWPVLWSHNNQKGDIDACVLWVPSLNIKQVRVSQITPKIGEEIYYIGAPGGVYHPPTVPIFKGIYSGVIDPSSAMITAPAAGGASGAAVLNYKNEIIGVVWGVNLRFNHITSMTNHRSFLLFIKKCK